MDKDKKIRFLQFAYAGVLAENVYFMGKNGVLEKVTAEKKAMHKLRGAANAELFGITKPEEVFTTLSEIFGCANWQVNSTDKSLTATATSCVLCAMAKKSGAPKPCNIYCLDSMSAIIEALSPGANYIVESTLWEEEKCLIKVTMQN